MNAVRPFLTTQKDLPKVSGQPQPEEPIVFTVYLMNGKMRARCHLAGDFTKGLYDAEIINPENFAGIVETWRKK
jgi:hypothetical protein